MINSFGAILLILAITLASGQEGVRPGFRARITQRGLDYGAEIALDLLLREMQGLSLPGITASAVGSTITINNMRIVSFPRPTGRMYPVAGRGLTFSGRNISPSIRANFHIRSKIGFWTINKRGEILAEASDLTLTMAFSIGRDYNGRPMLYGISCIPGGDDIDVSFRGSFSSLLNFAFRAFRSRIRSAIKAQLCAQAKTQIERELTSELATLPTAVTIDEDYEIDYRLVLLPQFTANYLETSHKGSISLKTAPGPPSFDPPVIPAHPEHTERMVYLYVTDYLMNTGLQSAFDNGRMAYNVTQQNIPAEARPFLSTTCPFSLCVGVIYPQVSEMYPDSTVDIDIHATVPPVGRVSGNEVFAYGTGEAQFFVRPDGNRVPLFTVSLNISAGLEINVVGNRVVFNITEVNPSAEIKETFIGDVGTGFLFETIMRLAFRQLLLPMLHGLGSNGVVLPSMDGVEFVNGVVIDHDTEDVFIIGTDIRYTPA